MSKVFCIGFHKTGTTTLGQALEILGYRVCGPRRSLAENLQKGHLDPVWKITEQYDAFQDNPWPILFRELDQKYPGSKFILTYRDPDTWVRSAVNHFGKKPNAMRKWIYGKDFGFPEGNEDVYLNRFNQHYQDVKDYFKNRTEDLLEIDLATGDGWEKICPFLDQKMPDQPFPHANKRSYSPFYQWMKKLGIR